MRTRPCGLLALLLFAASILSACAPYEPPLPARETVTSRCEALADAVATHARAVPADRLDAMKWHRYVSCALASYMVVDSRDVQDNPEAVVSVRLNADGSVESASLLHPSGNDAWDAAVQRAIAAASPLPPAPAKRSLTRVDMHFRPKPGGNGTDGATGISDMTHWSVRHCRMSGSLTSCG